ncbi:MAG TPA: 2'-5' RNA ligase family protein, partial [Sphingomicrobium sp.]|nr:2'-5' RNA ligase family protein [Sphingomicrobium sp.]
ALQQAGLEPEHRSFSPHVTLARWNRRSSEAVDTFLRRHSDLGSNAFTLDRFILFESKLSRHGPHYEEVAAFPLR